MKPLHCNYFNRGTSMCHLLPFTENKIGLYCLVQSQNLSLTAFCCSYCLLQKHFDIFAYLEFVIYCLLQQILPFAKTVWYFCYLLPQKKIKYGTFHIQSVNFINTNVFSGSENVCRQKIVFFKNLSLTAFYQDTAELVTHPKLSIFKHFCSEL